MSCAKQWSDNSWEKMSSGEAIWHKHETQSMAGKLLDVCIHALSTRMSAGRCVGTTYLKYVVSKKDWPSENCAKESTA